MKRTGLSAAASLSILLAAAPATHADDLLEIVEAAIAQDPVFGAAEHAYASEVESLPQARSALLPELSLDYQRNYTSQEVVESENTVFALGSDRFYSDNTGLRVTQNIFDWERRSRLNQSRATVSRAEAELLEARQALYLRAAEAYFGVLEKMDQLETVTDEMTALEGHYRLAERRAESGLGRDVDVDDAEARYLTAVAKEIEIQSALADSLYALSVLTGWLPGPLDPLREDLDFLPPMPADPAAWVAIAAESNPVIIARQHAVEEASQEVRARKGARFPTLDLVLADATQDTDGSVFGGGSVVDRADIALEFKIPFYQGGLTGSRIREALSDEQRATEELTQARRESEREVRDAYQRVVASIAQIEALTQSVAAQQRTLDLKTAGYNSGRYNILEVLDAQQDLSRVQQGETKARYDYALNTLRLQRAAGALSEQDLETVNGWLVSGGN
jgi:outer membrane protein